MATLKHNAFGAAWRDVMDRVGGTQFNIQDVARVATAVASGSTATVIQVASTEGLAAGDAVNINSGSFPEGGETRTIATVDSATQFTVSAGFSSAPVAGDVVNDGPAQLEACLAQAETDVESLLPDRYRRLLTRVEGEVIVRRADAGQTTATLCGVTSPFATSPTDVRLYADYAGDWGDRTGADAMDASAYSVVGRTVTFTSALSEGTQVVAEYGHSLDAAPAVLKHCVIDIAAHAAAGRAHRDHEATEAAWVAEFAARARDRLAGMAGDRHAPPRGIPEFDELDLYDDWTREPAAGVRTGQIHLV
jgi:hypothetical protein